MKYYLAGPMRGYPQYNFPEFESATRDLRGRGLEIISPHEMDLGMGFDPNSKQPLVMGFVKECIRRDVDAILQCDGVVFLPNWRHSTGARAEKAIADWLGVPSMTYPYLDSIYADNSR